MAYQYPNPPINPALAATSNPFALPPYTPDKVIPKVLGYGQEDAPSDFEFELTEVKMHALALTRWINQWSFLKEGVPTPVIWATPMDAFSQFDKLWQDANSPFAYLKGMGQPDGAAVVFPVVQRFPLINIDFRGMSYAADRSYSGRTYRRLGWPTVEGQQTPGVTLSSLGYVSQARMPLAFNYRYQVDHWALRPDTQAFFIRQLLKSVRASGAELQTYVRTLYPSYYGNALVKLKIDSDINDTTEKDPTDQTVKYRTTINCTLEGWAIDQTLTVTPTFWTVNNMSIAFDPNHLDQIYLMNSTDLRPYQQNPVLGLRQNLPPGTVVGSVVAGGTNWGNVA